jgi:hypothetical protein
VTSSPLSARSAGILAAPLAVLLAHALLFGSWIVDDAGISFVYARNLAAGHGLVAQPGLSPVEGFSNFLWVVGLAPAFLLRLFDPVLTPKILALALVAGAFALLHGALAAVTGGSRAASVTVLLLLALNTSFVVWAISGLENPLYTFLLCLLLRLCLQEREGEAERALRWLPAAAGAVAAGIALTRPDGILFAALYPLLSPFAAPASKRAAAGRVLRYAAVLALLLGSFLLFRALYFGDLYPNTYHAKGGPGAGKPLDLLTLQPPMVADALELLRSVAGPASGLLLAALAGGTFFLLGRRRFRRGHAALLAFTLCAAAVYLLLPEDWMPEYRFATPFFPFFYAYGAALAAALGAELFPRPERRRLAALVAVPAVAGASLLLFVPRSLLFAARPTVPFADVVRDFGTRYDRYADLLGVRNGSILLPDVGGTLWASRLRVYDLVGLTDRTIALTRDSDHAAFLDYVFERAKPTFIHTHHYWTMAAGFDLDPRLRRDYVPLFRYLERWVLEASGGQTLLSGDYVRRDALEAAPGRDAALAVIRRELAEQHAHRPREQGPAGPAAPPR